MFVSRTPGTGGSSGSYFQIAQIIVYRTVYKSSISIRVVLRNRFSNAMHFMDVQNMFQSRAHIVFYNSRNSQPTVKLCISANSANIGHYSKYITFCIFTLKKISKIAELCTRVFQRNLLRTKINLASSIEEYPLMLGLGLIARTSGF